jgi:hypothetical protein
MLSVCTALRIAPFQTCVNLLRSQSDVKFSRNVELGWQGVQIVLRIRCCIGGVVTLSKIYITLLTFLTSNSVSLKFRVSFVRLKWSHPQGALIHGRCINYRSSCTYGWMRWRMVMKGIFLRIVVERVMAYPLLLYWRYNHVRVLASCMIIIHRFLSIAFIFQPRAPRIMRFWDLSLHCAVILGSVFQSPLCLRAWKKLFSYIEMLRFLWLDVLATWASPVLQSSLF